MRIFMLAGHTCHEQATLLLDLRLVHTNGVPASDWIIIAATGSVEEMQPAYNASMPSLQDTSFNEFVRSLDANGLDAASLGHVGIMDEVAAPQGFINVPGQSELQVS